MLTLYSTLTHTSLHSILATSSSCIVWIRQEGKEGKRKRKKRKEKERPERQISSPATISTAGVATALNWADSTALYGNRGSRIVESEGETGEQEP